MEYPVFWGLELPEKYKQNFLAFLKKDSDPISAKKRRFLLNFSFNLGRQLAPGADSTFHFPRQKMPLTRLSVAPRLDFHSLQLFSALDWKIPILWSVQLYFKKYWKNSAFLAFKHFFKSWGTFSSPAASGQEFVSNSLDLGTWVQIQADLYLVTTL